VEKHRIKIYHILLLFMLLLSPFELLRFVFNSLLSEEKNGRNDHDVKRCLIYPTGIK